MELCYGHIRLLIDIAFGVCADRHSAETAMLNS